MARRTRGELHDWLERVERRAPTTMNPVQRYRAKDPKKLAGWCVDGPGEALAVLNDEAQLRAQAERHRQRAASIRDNTDRARKSLRENFSPFPGELARLDAVLDGDAQDPEATDSVANFARDLKTLQQLQAVAEELMTKLTGDGRSELRQSLHRAASDPRRVDHLLLGVRLAEEVLNLERRHARSEWTLEHAPDKLKASLAEQTTEIALQEEELARLETQLDSTLQEHLQISTELEHRRRGLSKIQADLDRLTAKFEVLLSRARTNSTFVARELYEAYRERTDREVVWRERVAAEARTRAALSALSEQGQRADALRRRLSQCNEKREQLEWERNHLQAEANHLANDYEELSTSFHRLGQELERVQADRDQYQARALPVTDLELAHNDKAALLRAGIYTLGSLSDWFSGGVEQIPGLSSGTLDTIGRVLHRHGFRR